MLGEPLQIFLLFYALNMLGDEQNVVRHEILPLLRQSGKNSARASKPLYFTPLIRHFSRPLICEVFQGSFHGYKNSGTQRGPNQHSPSIPSCEQAVGPTGWDRDLLA